MADEKTELSEKKLKLLLDKLHGEELDMYSNLIKHLAECCQISILKKKPLDFRLLSENDVFMVISPNKLWDKSEIETVRNYVENFGGILIVMTIDGRKPQRLNEFLEPYGFTIAQGTVDEKSLCTDVLRGSKLLKGIDSLVLGKVWGYSSTKIASSDEIEVMLQYNDAILGAKRSLGKGTVYLFSCLPLLGSKQLNYVDNRRFLDNLLKSVATPSMTVTLQMIAENEVVSVQVKATSAAQQYVIYFRDPLTEVVGESGMKQHWDTKSPGSISWTEYGLAITGSSTLSAAEKIISQGVLGQIFVRTLFESVRLRTIYVTKEEILKVVLAPLPQSPKSTSSGIVHIFTEKSDGNKQIHCFCFTESKDSPKSLPPLWLFWGWLTKNIPEEKLETLSDQYNMLKSMEISDVVTTHDTKIDRTDLRIYPKGSLKEKLDALIDELLPKESKQSWYRQPKIPSKKLKNAIFEYAPEITDDEVLFLGDTTVFGSAKKGFMLTTRGIYYNCETKGSVTWSEIQKAVSAGGFPSYYLKLTINKGSNIEKVSIECTGFHEVRPALEQLINHVTVLIKET